MEEAKRRLLWHGMLLFLLGLLTGFVEQKFNNPRMGLAAHLEGVMNGIFLVALGAAWTEVRLSSRLNLQHAGVRFMARTRIGWSPRWQQSSVQRPYLRLQQRVIVLNRGKRAL
jgi:hypothetical protein